MSWQETPTRWTTGADDRGVSSMMYKSKSGWLFKVVWHYEGCLKGGWRAYYQKPKTSAWRVVSVLPNCRSRAEAEDDLAEYAARHGMQDVEE